MDAKKRKLTQRLLKSEPARAATKRVRGAARKARIVLAPHVISAQYQQEIDEFLEKVFGIDGALVTDESRCWDFSSDAQVRKTLWRVRARDAFGFDPCFGQSDPLIIDIARELREHRKAP